MSLTEDRTFKEPYMAEIWVERFIKNTAHGTMIKECVLADPKDNWEGRFSYSGAYSEEFRDTVAELARKFTKNLNASARALVQKNDVKELIAGEKFTLSKLDSQRLSKSISFLSKLGYDVSEYPIHVTEYLGEGVLGCAQDGTIFLSKRVFMMGTKMVAGTVLEEYIHLKHGHSDCDRGMQNFLFDALMSLGEQVTGEVL